MKQGEIEQITANIQDIMSDLEIRIMSDIVRRIRINGFSTDSADYQATRLQQLGASEENIKKWIQEALEAAEEEVDAIFSDTLYEQYTGHQRAYRLFKKEQIPYEDNKPLQDLINAVRIQISGAFGNLSGSSGFVTKDPSGRIVYSPLMVYYRRVLDNAVMDIHSGAFSYDTVLKRTVKQLTASGLRWVDYDSGKRFRVDVAARMTVMTGFRQVQGLISQQTAADLGTDMYEVTWHAGARPTHQPWQGKVYSYRQLVDVCGLGSVTGLHGANCYHDYSPFIPGFSLRTYTDKWLDDQNKRENTPKSYCGEKYTTYQALQRQRKLERSMRRCRQDIKLLQEGEANEGTVILAKAKYSGLMQEYRAFSGKMGLPLQNDRIYQDGLGRMK